MKLKELFEAEKKHVELCDYLAEHCMSAMRDIAQTGCIYGRGFATPHQKPYYFDIDKTRPEYQEALNLIKSSSIKGGPISSRSDRKPRNTPLWVHTLVDEFFEEKFGVKLRSSSVFVFSARGSYNYPETYGPTSFVIPIGEYESYHSPKIMDLTVSLVPKEQLEDYPETPEARELVLNVLKDADYEKGNIDGLKYTKTRSGPLNPLKGAEIMLQCKEYLAIPTKQLAGGIVIAVAKYLT